MSFHIVKGDLFEQKVDAIVVTASPRLKLEGVIGSKVKETCGDRLLEELKQTKKPSLSQCIITNAYNLPCQRIIHVATPRWNGGDYGEEDFLRDSYLNCLYKLEDFELHSIAFPLLSGGANEFPTKKAVEIAIKTLSTYDNEDIDIVLVIYKKHTWDSYRKLMQKYTLPGGELSENDKMDIEMVMNERRGFHKWYKPGSETVLSEGVEEQSIGQKLTFFIKTKGLSYFDAYNGVISKKFFDDIVKGVKTPSKNALISLGIHIGLDGNEIDELLFTIGERLDPYIDRDNLIMTAIWKFPPEEYNGDNRIEEMNKILREYNFVPLKEKD